MGALVDWGYWGLFLGSFLSSTIIPMSADVLLLAVLSLGGDIFFSLFLATIGNWLGGLTSYWLGWLGKWSYLERWFKISRDKLLHQQQKVERYGVSLALFTWLPIVGDLFAITLGFYRIRPYFSALYMLIGRFVRFAIWAFLYAEYGQTFVQFISN